MAQGLFYSAARPYVLAEIEARKKQGYAESRRQLGIYIKMTTKGGYIDSTDDTSIASRYSKSTGKPTPALQNLKIEMSGEYGTLKRGNATVKCFDKASFEEFEKAFLIPGTDIVIEYGRIGGQGPALNGKFDGVVYDYSFKLNNQLGYDCELKVMAKGSMATEMNVNSKLKDTGRTFTSDFDGFNDISSVVNICDVFDYDVQEQMNAQEDLSSDDGESFSFSGIDNAHMAGTDCPDSGPEPTTDGMVGGNIIFCSVGYIVNRLLNQELLNNNAEADTTTKKHNLKIYCNDQVTIGRAFDYMFSSNPMKVLITSGKERNEKYGGNGGSWVGACKHWGGDFDSANVLDGSRIAKLANIYVSRDVLRAAAGAGAKGKDGKADKEGSKTSVQSFLATIFSEIYTNTGGAWDLTMTSMGKDQCGFYGVPFSENAMYIVDRNWAPGSKVEKLKFNALNAAALDNSTRNVQITGKVPKDMAAAAMVGGSGTASGKKGTEPANVLKGVIGKKIQALADKGKLQKAMKENLELIHDNGYSEEEIISARTNLKAYVEGGQSPKEKASFRKDMYPLELSATLDGIEGIQFGNACISDLVPSRYFTATPRVCFTVTKTSHTLSGNDWITDVETICRLEP